MNKVELNQHYRVKPAFAKGEGGTVPSMAGKVVYVHPHGRYAVLEFKGHHGPARESFELSKLTEKNRVQEREAHRS
ncbi:MAG: hypothetical protein IJ448_01385 [Oscillospiraceae bacterium]|nr:hypothetical protein [Oscillospiraceae bacterium]